MEPERFHEFLTPLHALTVVKEGTRLQYLSVDLRLCIQSHRSTQ